MSNISFEAARWNGPKIVALGGGNGLASMLRGLKKYTENVTAIVTVADDGGSSGMLREDLGILPPGDLRNCILALSNTEPLMAGLIDYRFTEGSLKGQNVGNIVLAALNDICGSFSVAVAKLSEVLSITGRVLPVTLENVELEAEFENGARVRGESKIAERKRAENCRIERVKLIPEHPKALWECLESIRLADMIVFGPGSLYTSVVPNLLCDGVVEAIRDSDAVKVCVCNAMTQEGETEGYTVSDHIKGIFSHAGEKLFDICLANCARVSEATMREYEKEDSEQTRVDPEIVKKLGVKLVEREIITESGGQVRHDPKKLAKELLTLHYRYHDREDLRRFDKAMMDFLNQ